MKRRKHDANMDEMQGVAKRLRDERPEASPLELDRIKTTAMSRAKSGTRGRVGSRRLAVAGLTAGLLVATTGGVLAGGDGQSHGNASITQYGNNCIAGNNNTGNGGDSNGNGGNGNGNGGGNGGSFNGNGSGNFNCNEDSFNTEITNITTINTTSGGAITNNYYSTTVSATPAASTGVLGSKTSKGVSSGSIKIHIKVPRGLKLRKVSVKVNGKGVKTLYGKKASANIQLVNLPCSTSATTVTITVKLSNGKTVTSTHQYKVCAS
jgi:hypothetical protein